MSSRRAVPKSRLRALPHSSIHCSICSMLVTVLGIGD